MLITERAYSTTVNGIERIESQSIPGIGIMQGLLPAGHRHRRGHRADLVGVVDASCASRRPGCTPPNVIQFNASNVPVAQLTASSDTLPEQQIFDYGLNFIRVRLFTIPGLSTPAPFGGKQRQINVDIDPRGARGQGALAAGRGQRAARRRTSSCRRAPRASATASTTSSLNSSPSTRRASSTTSPSRSSAAQPVLLGDVAHVADALRRPDQHRARRRQARDLPGDPQARRRLDAGRRRRRARRAARSSRQPRPTGLELKIDFDQSVFVRGAIKSVAARGDHLVDPRVADDRACSSAAGAAMVIVCTSIPLAIFCAIIGLQARRATRSTS